MDTAQRPGRLTEQQQQKVADNLKLVTLHLRQRVAVKQEPRRDREWEDLFQEGCVGLMQAVQSFPADSDMPFPAYALPRIHTAVSRALRGAFATVKQPLYPRRGDENARDRTLPTTVSLDFEPADRRPDPRHQLDQLDHPTTGESISDRIRARYVRALRRVADRMQRVRPVRPDRAELVRRIVEHRLLVPDTDERVSLRSIARETGSSFARVAQCEKRSIELLHTELTDDVETQRLRQAARRSEQGMETLVDTTLQREVQDLRVERFLRVLGESPPARRGALLLDLIAQAGTSPELVARQLLAPMPPRQRDAVLCAWEDSF